MHRHVAALVLLASCTATIRISRDELQADLAKQFPREVDKHVVTIRASDPRLEFPGTGLVAVRLRVEATSATGNSHLTGDVRAAGRIEYVAAEHAFYLRDPKVTELVFDPAEGPGHLSRAMNHATSTFGTKLVERAARSGIEELLRRNPIYRLDPGRKKDAKAMRHLKSVHVEGQDLVLEVAL